MEDIRNRLIKKSVEAFEMAIEIYNKPTIRYRVEGFALFICNSWELMLKAHMLNKRENIYFTDNPDRTISLENCIKKVFTNDKDPLRRNLEKIIELRNTSTHFITEEYEMVYVPLFQACVLNFNEKMEQFHEIDMTTIIPQNFLTLSVSMKTLDESKIVAKYPEEIATKLLKNKGDIDDLSENNNANFAISINHHHYITKSESKATSKVKIDANAETGVKIINKLQDPNKTHAYTTKKCIELINGKLKKEGIYLTYKDNKKAKFNSYHFSNFCKHFEIKEKTDFCYVNTIHSSPSYSYSNKAINFIFEELKKDPENILNHIKSNL
ncbi:hypothetical protein A4S06_05185 [Erysipelotrichaceae bacterium MTC7]|nr:hypothetical protein A4S06_05185 [Erysipelotrichaceae bacterium MTC7]